MRHAYVYVLHFDTPLHHAQHYIGSTTNLKERLIRHAKGQGARLTQVLVANGKGWKVGGLFQVEVGEERAAEREAKKSHNGGRYCSLCGGLSTLLNAKAIDPDILEQEVIRAKEAKEKAG